MKKNLLKRPTFFILLAAALVFAGTGSQCAQVDDRVTAPGSTGGADDGSGVAGGESDVAACVQACNEAARDARSDEQDLHRENKAACRLLEGDARQECQDAENARHSSRMQEIALDLQICKAPCHEQGGGSGGQ